MELRKVPDEDGKYRSKTGSRRSYHVKVESAPRAQAFSPHFLTRSVEEGWLKWEGERLTIDATPPTVYRIVRSPGVYCCHCGRKLEDGGGVALAHVENVHTAGESPDRENPAGYRIDNFYYCEKEEKIG